MLEKDGTKILYASGQELTEDGVYTLTFENFDGYEAGYIFTIDTLVPEASLQGAENGETVNGDVCVVFEEEEHAELFRNGTSLGEYCPGQSFRRTENTESLYGIARAMKRLWRLELIKP